MDKSDIEDMIWGKAIDYSVYAIIGMAEREECYKKLKNPNLNSKNRKIWMNKFIFVCQYERKTGTKYKRLIFPF